MTTLESNDVLQSPDGITSAVSFTTHGNELAVCLRMSPSALAKLQGVADASGDSLDEVISKAFVLYIEAAEANRKGKSVGIASSSEMLETQFVGF